MSDKMPVFVKIEDSTDIIDVLNLTKDKLRKAKFLLEKLTELRAEESAALAEWQKQISGVEERVSRVENKMFSQ